MKKKGVIINLLLTLIVLFPILFQVVHIYEHHSENREAQQQSISQDTSENQLKMNQTISEDCFVCDFKFTVHSLTSIFIYSFPVDSSVAANQLFFLPKVIYFYCGSLFSLRAPPHF